MLPKNRTDSYSCACSSPQTKHQTWQLPCNEKLHKEPSAFARTLQKLCGTRTVCHGWRNIWWAVKTIYIGRPKQLNCFFRLVGLFFFFSKRWVPTVFWPALFLTQFDFNDGANCNYCNYIVKVKDTNHSFQAADTQTSVSAPPWHPDREGGSTISPPHHQVRNGWTHSVLSPGGCGQKKQSCCLCWQSQELYSVLAAVGSVSRRAIDRFLHIWKITTISKLNKDLDQLNWHNLSQTVQK